MEELLRQISNQGFAMVVAVYLLIRFESKLDSVTSTLAELSSVIRAMKDNNGEGK